jgi:hypothetical protein
MDAPEADGGIRGARRTARATTTGRARTSRWTCSTTTPCGTGTVTVTSTSFTRRCVVRSPVVGLAPLDRERPVDLLDEEQTGETMGQRHGRKAQALGGEGVRLRPEPLGRSHEEGDARVPCEEPVEVAGEAFRVERAPGPVERHDVAAAARLREPPAERPCVAVVDLGDGGGDVPVDALEVLGAQIVDAAVARAPDGDDPELQFSVSGVIGRRSASSQRPSRSYIWRVSR